MSKSDSWDTLYSYLRDIMIEGYESEIDVMQDHSSPEYVAFRTYCDILDKMDELENANG